MTTPDTERAEGAAGLTNEECRRELVAAYRAIVALAQQREAERERGAALAEAAEALDDVLVESSDITFKTGHSIAVLLKFRGALAAYRGESPLDLRAGVAAYREGR